MVTSGRIVRYSAAELAEMRRRGESQTDWARVDAMTDEELEASIDYEEEGEFDISQGMPGIPGWDNHLMVRVDPDLMAWFKAQGNGYNTRVNAVLRDYVEAQRRASAEREG